MFKIFMRIAAGLAFVATGALIAYDVVSSRKLRKEKEKMKKVVRIIDEADKAIKDPSRTCKTKANEECKILIIFENVKTGERIEVDPDDHKKFDECMSNKNLRLLFE